MVAATGTLEWTCLLLSEASEGIGEIREYEKHLKSRTPVIVTDCKSLYDHLVAVSSPTSVEDRRTSIDIVILRQSASTQSDVSRFLDKKCWRPYRSFARMHSQSHIPD